MTENLAVFPNPDPTPVALTDAANDLHALIAQRYSLLSQVQARTIQIRDGRVALDTMLTEESVYVEGVATGSAETIAQAGMAVAAEATRVGPMPKVLGLVATQGDEDGFIDLHWEPVKRGLLNYTLEMTTAVGGQGGWQYVSNPSKSSASVPGLTSGQRYWFRVTANGSAGAGAPSDMATKTAP